ncbi:MAG: hypothetical protein HQK54_09930 [Oligoflexales bacterium]|nr:hypothetical protein [Oligoflexales bacterium]
MLKSNAFLSGSMKLVFLGVLACTVVISGCTKKAEEGDKSSPQTDQGTTNTGAPSNTAGSGNVGATNATQPTIIQTIGDTQNPQVSETQGMEISGECRRFIEREVAPASTSSINFTSSVSASAADSASTSTSASSSAPDDVLTRLIDEAMSMGGNSCVCATTRTLFPEETSSQMQCEALRDMIVGADAASWQRAFLVERAFEIANYGVNEPCNNVIKMNLPVHFISKLASFRGRSEISDDLRLTYLRYLVRAQGMSFPGSSFDSLTSELLYDAARILGSSTEINEQQRAYEIYLKLGMYDDAMRMFNDFIRWRNLYNTGAASVEELQAMNIRDRVLNFLDMSVLGNGNDTSFTSLIDELMVAKDVLAASPEEESSVNSRFRFNQVVENLKNKPIYDNNVIWRTLALGVLYMNENPVEARIKLQGFVEMAAWDEFNYTLESIDRRYRGSERPFKKTALLKMKMLGLAYRLLSSLYEDEEESQNIRGQMSDELKYQIRYYFHPTNIRHMGNVGFRMNLDFIKNVLGLDVNAEAVLGNVQESRSLDRLDQDELSRSGRSTDNRFRELSKRFSYPLNLVLQHGGVSLDLIKQCYITAERQAVALYGKKYVYTLLAASWNYWAKRTEMMLARSDSDSIPIRYEGVNSVSEDYSSLMQPVLEKYFQALNTEEDRVIEGTGMTFQPGIYELASTTRFDFERLVLLPGAIIITNGHDLSVRGSLEGGIVITSPEALPVRALPVPGTPGVVTRSDIHICVDKANDYVRNYLREHNVGSVIGGLQYINIGHARRLAGFNNACNEVEGTTDIYDGLLYFENGYEPVYPSTASGTAGFPAGSVSVGGNLKNTSVFATGGIGGEGSDAVSPFGAYPIRRMRHDGESAGSWSDPNNHGTPYSGSGGTGGLGGGVSCMRQENSGIFSSGGAGGRSGPSAGYRSRGAFGSAGSDGAISIGTSAARPAGN